MKLHRMKLMALCLVVCLCVWVESQDLLPAPTLEFSSSVNQSAVTRYSYILLVCTIPENASLPADVYLSQDDSTARSRFISSSTIRSQRPVEFSLSIRPDYETAFVCWYRNAYTKAQSRFSESLDVVVTALSNPKLSLIPPVFPVGANYTVQCEVLQVDYKNITVHMYDRLVPIRTSREAFKYIGSRFLLPRDTGVEVYHINAKETYEFLCEEEVFQRGRTLRSRSTITATPEELPVRLVPKDADSGTCYGLAYLKVKEDWRPLCFPPEFSGSSNVANVICRDLGCGSAVTDEMLAQSAPDAVGTPICKGQEKKLAECPITVQYGCNQGTLNVACSATLPPPKLSLLYHGAPSRVYVRTEQPVTLECVFESPVSEAYITFTQNGNDRYSSTARSGYKQTWVLSETVPEGEYACYVQSRGSSSYKTGSSNVIGIYIYDPPPAGAVAGGVITTIVGVFILVMLCVYRGGS